MAQSLDPLPNERFDRIVCCYVNATSKIQIGRIRNIPNWYFERVIFPGQRLIFETTTEAQLEIHTGMMASAILSDTIPCQRLIMKEFETAPPLNPSPEFQQQLEEINEGKQPVAIATDTMASSAV
jgi:hypothetical protein